jgi:hypothetical protein
MATRPYATACYIRVVPSRAISSAGGSGSRRPGSAADTASASRRIDSTGRSAAAARLSQQRSKQQRDRSDEEQLCEQALQRLHPLLDRCPDDHHDRPILGMDGRGQQS